MQLVHRDYDPLTGITEETWFEEGIDGKPDRITLRRLQDVDHILMANKIAFNSFMSKKPSYTGSDGFHKVASIPSILIEKWIREGFNWFTATDSERRARLNDRDYQKLLTRPGKL